MRFTLKPSVERRKSDSSISRFWGGMVGLLLPLLCVSIGCGGKRPVKGLRVVMYDIFTGEKDGFVTETRLIEEQGEIKIEKSKIKWEEVAQKTPLLAQKYLRRHRDFYQRVRKVLREIEGIDVERFDHIYSYLNGVVAISVGNSAVILDLQQKKILDEFETTRKIEHGHYVATMDVRGLCFFQNKIALLTFNRELERSQIRILGSEVKFELGKGPSACSTDGRRIATLLPSNECVIREVSPQVKEVSRFKVDGNYARIMWSIKDNTVIFFNYYPKRRLWIGTVYDTKGRCLLPETEVGGIAGWAIDVFVP